MDATENIVLKATPAYHYESFTENRHNDNQNSNAVHMNDVTHKVVNTTSSRVQQLTPINHFQPIPDDTSSTLNHASDQDINDIDNSSEVSESQSIEINKPQ